MVKVLCDLKQKMTIIVFKSLHAIIFKIMKFTVSVYFNMIFIFNEQNTEAV